MTAIYDVPAPSSLEQHSSGRACHAVTIDWVDDPSEPTEILITEKAVGSDDQTHNEVALALTPPQPIPTDRLKAALNDVANVVRASLPHLPPVGYLDILTRRPPRVKSGRTLPRSGNDARCLEGREPVVPEILVDHDSNSTDSGEEAERIVDKFQGREAPVVFFSLAASSAEDAPRGISFLLNRNRVKVAISRAKYAAYIVRSPRLTEFLPASPAWLVELGAFLALTQSGG